MRLNLFLTFLLLTTLAFSFGTAFHRLILKADNAVEEKIAQEQPESGHPIGAIYSADSSYAPHEELRVMYNGAGLARVLSDDPNLKTLLDYQSQRISTIRNSSANFWVSQSRLDPYSYPAVLNPQSAQEQGAHCVGAGTIKKYPYHRWRKQIGANEWEVWTDDRDHFPVYFRSIRNGEVLSWTIVNSWIDSTTAGTKTFFAALPDPPPPSPASPTPAITEKKKSDETKTKSARAIRKHKHRQT